MSSVLNNLSSTADFSPRHLETLRPNKIIEAQLWLTYLLAGLPSTMRWGIVPRVMEKANTHQVLLSWGSKPNMIMGGPHLNHRSGPPIFHDYYKWLCKLKAQNPFVWITYMCCNQVQASELEMSKPNPLKSKFLRFVAGLNPDVGVRDRIQS